MFSHSFFFSSRRRHTRYIGDWSSDLCSSDLAVAEREAEEEPALPHIRLDRALQFLIGDRSEERRVGKECRVRWWPKRKKKKRRIQKDECIRRFKRYTNTLVTT